jgi:HlyD family secretion protein
MKNKINQYLLLALLFGAGCGEPTPAFDASGAFETEETIISAEGSGILRQWSLSEGDVLSAGQFLGYVDTTALALKKTQLFAQIRAIGSRLPDIAAQSAVYDRQLAVNQSKLDHLRQERDRLAQLLLADAATRKQLDDMEAAILEVSRQAEVIRQQQAAQVTALQTQRKGLSADPMPLLAQVAQVDHQIARSRIVNPVAGTVLSSYARRHEMVGPGKPLYKIADLSTLYLRAYVDGGQLPQIRLRQPVTVRTDNGPDTSLEVAGVVTWISDQAEFTPKTILTRSERTNLVYAVKIRVDNPDGRLKPGMYGEVVF